MFPLAAVMTGESGAEDAFLHPCSAFGELAIGGQAGKLGAGPGPAGRAVVCLAWAEDEIAGMRAGLSGGPNSST